MKCDLQAVYCTSWKSRGEWLKCVNGPDVAHGLQFAHLGIRYQYEDQQRICQPQQYSVHWSYCWGMNWPCDASVAAGSYVVKLTAVETEPRLHRSVGLHVGVESNGLQLQHGQRTAVVMLTCTGTLSMPPCTDKAKMICNMTRYHIQGFNMYSKADRCQLGPTHDIKIKKRN